MVGQILLAALLVPELFGQWALIQATVMLVSGFGITGVREVLIHRAESFRLWSGPALWFSAVWGAALSLGLAAGAWPLAELLADGQDVPAVCLGLLVVSPAPCLQALIAVPRAKLMMDLRFGRAGLAYTIPGLIQVVLTVLMAWAGAGLFAFTLPFVLAIAVRTVMIFAWSGIPRIGRPHVRRWRYFTGDAGRVWWETTAVWVRNQADVVLLAPFVDPMGIGLYFSARNMSRQAIALMTLQVSGVLQPILASLRHDPPRLLAAYMRACRLLAFAGVPMTLGIAALMWPGTPLLLDRDLWADLPLPLACMCLGIALRILTESAVSMKFALGLFKQQQRFSIYSSVLFILLITLGAAAGQVNGASLGYLAFCLITGPGQFFTSVKPVGGGWPQTIRAVFLPVLLSLAAIGPWLLIAAPDAGDARWILVLKSVVLVVGAAVSYVALAVLLRLPELAELLDRVREQAPARLRPLAARLSAPLTRRPRGAP
jgi:PST family polysaccharide transporter